MAQRWNACRVLYLLSRFRPRGYVQENRGRIFKRLSTIWARTMSDIIPEIPDKNCEKCGLKTTKLWSFLDGKKFRGWYCSTPEGCGFVDRPIGNEKKFQFQGKDK